MDCFWYKTPIIIKVYNPWVTSYLNCRFGDGNVYFINMQMTLSPLSPHHSFWARADQSLFQFWVHIANATFTSEKLSFDPKTSSICWIKLLQSGPNEVISKQHNGVIELIKGGRGGGHCLSGLGPASFSGDVRFARVLSTKWLIISRSTKGLSPNCVHYTVKCV